jgi:FkbM family methyltransferase
MLTALVDGNEFDVMDGAELVSRTLCRGKWYERELLDAIKAQQRAGVYVDVGAHIGNHAVWFARYCPSTWVVAIEPWAPARDLLMSNLLRVMAQSCISAAVVGVEGAHVVQEEHFRGAKRQPLWLVRDARDDDPPERVQVSRSLDALLSVVLSPDERVAVLKIDVDWWEAQVLDGAATVLQEQRPLVALEVADGDAALSRLLALPALKGYHVIGRYCRTPTYLLEHAP